ncbi:MAG: Orange carotenoid protein [Cyanobacteria bacterium Co-bin8]|nr:Orange carotenoid protein [Cyanobacteria bacterium Co-bin8]
MAYTNAVNNTDNALENFRRLGTDEQLAWLWFVYEQMGDAVTPAAPGAASPEIAGGLFEQVKEQSHEQQLDTMRAIANRDANNQICREYGSLSANTKLAFWFFLSCGMDEGTIIPMPDDYKMSDEGQNLLAALESMELEQQIRVLRDAVAGMGAEPAAGAAI